MRNLQVTEDIIQQTMEYLSHKPWREVAHLIAPLSTLEEAPERIAKEPKPTELDEKVNKTIKKKK